MTTTCERPTLEARVSLAGHMLRQKGHFGPGHSFELERIDDDLYRLAVRTTGPVVPCTYCGPGNCRGSAWTARGDDVTRWARIHPEHGVPHRIAPYPETSETDLVVGTYNEVYAAASALIDLTAVLQDGYFEPGNWRFPR